MRTYSPIGLKSLQHCTLDPHAHVATTASRHAMSHTAFCSTLDFKERCAACESGTMTHPWMQRLVQCLRLMRAGNLADCGATPIYTQCVPQDLIGFELCINTMRIFIPYGLFLLDTHESECVARANWKIYRSLHTEEGGEGLNASAMPAVCHANYFLKPQDLAIERASSQHQKQLHILESDVALPVRRAMLRNAAAREMHIARGNTYEPEAKTAFVRNTHHVLVDEIPDKLVFSNTAVFDGKLFGTPDGLCMCGLVLETKVPVKSCNSKLKSYYDQVQACMALVGAERGVLYQHMVGDPEELYKNGKQKPRIAHMILRDPMWMQNNIPNVQAFYLQCRHWNQLLRASLFHKHIVFAAKE